MHPFYGPSQRLLADRAGRREGIASMAAYLAFWAVVVAVGQAGAGPALAPGRRAAEPAGPSDPALEALRAALRPR